MKEFIEETILSVLNQRYPALEYIIIDGGSTDGTCEIIEKYKDQLAYYVSEPDGGMYDAIRKGFSKATGDIYAWLNADDIYLPWTFRTLDKVFSTFQNVDWVCGIPSFLTENGLQYKFYARPGCKNRNDIRMGRFNPLEFGCMQQESMFWRSSLYHKVGGIDCSFKYAGDFDLWTRFADNAELCSIDSHLSVFRRRDTSLSREQLKYYNEEVSSVLAKRNRKISHILSSSILFRFPYRFIRKRKSPVIYIQNSTNALIYKENYRKLACFSLIDIYPIYIKDYK